MIILTSSNYLLMTEDTPEDELLKIIARNKIGYEEFRQTYTHHTSLAYRQAYLKLYNRDLITEDRNAMMTLTQKGREVLKYSGYAVFDKVHQ